MNTQNSILKIRDRLGISAEQLAKFCQKWQVSELALFGSILRDDFQPDSDIDILVSYQPTAKRGLFEKITRKWNCGESLKITIRNQNLL